MPKKRPSSSVRRLVWLRRRLLIFVSILLCFLALLRLRHHSTLRPPLSASRGASRASHAPFQGPPKIAFLFLARRNLPLDFLWGTFFKNGDAANFSIYVHSKPGFVFDKSSTSSSFFYGRQLNNSVQVAWGEASMIEAEKLLLNAALDDPANQRFALLSDSCVPLYNFSFVYNYMMSSPRSFVDSFLNVKEGRYNPKMSPVIPKDKWRKGSQWIALVRRHAEIVGDDEVIFSVFKNFCKRQLQVALSNKLQIFKFLKRRACIPDEHYVQTLLAMSGLEDELERRTLTYTLWNQSAPKKHKEAWHPVMFGYKNATPDQIKEIKDINHVYYESEYRTEWCRVNSTFTSCFLFARKFSRGAAMRLLTEGVAGPFDATALLNSASLRHE